MYVQYVDDMKPNTTLKTKRINYRHDNIIDRFLVHHFSQYERHKIYIEQIKHPTFCKFTIN